jgi:anti-sigma-K factor RskA
LKDDMEDRIEQLLPFYILGGLSEEERDLVEAYFVQHPEARAEIRDLEFAASALPYSAPSVQPSSHPKESLMARVAADQGVRAPQNETGGSGARPRNRFAGFQAFSFGALGLLVALAALVLLFGLNRQVSRLQGEVAALQTALLAQASRIEQFNQELGQVNARLPQGTPSALTTFALNGTAAQPGAHGQLLTDPNSHSAVLVVDGLAPLESGRIYQVWLIKSEVPQSAGFLNVDSHGQGVSLLAPDQAIGSFDALGISIEPVQGSLKPTGDIVVLGEL